jgi:hypothetical protein
MEIITLSPDRHHPVPIFGRSKSLERFVAKLHKLRPEMAFVTTDTIRCVTQCTVDTLVHWELPVAAHRGCKLIHLERGGDPDRLVRPAAVIEILCADGWFLKKIMCGNRFSLEPVLQGISLTDAQESAVLRTEISKMVARKFG